MVLLSGFIEMYETLLVLLHERGTSFTIHEHAASHTYAEAMANLSFPAERLLKTVAFRLRSGETVLVALRGQDRVDYRRLAEALNTKRTDISSLSPDEVLAALGIEPGAVAPIPLNAWTQVLFDSGVTRSETIFTGIGRTDRTLEIMLDELVPITGGRIAPIARDPARAEAAP
jgi:Cys-tRNA(Pro)/Cys-tRNA(Cys) deacylase